MPYRSHRSNYLGFILLFVAIRVLFNLLALSHFGFQRDEMLHLALGDHLAWGYKEVPPFIAFIARISTLLFGSSIAAARVFTTVCSGCIILLTGLLTVELGGKKFAIAIACSLLSALNSVMSAPATKALFPEPVMTADFISGLL